MTFIHIPETRLPTGQTVPAFQVAQYLATAGEPNPAGVPCRRIGDRLPRQAAVNAEGHPWTSIDYNESRQAAEAAGFKLITELQALAIAWLIYQQDINWTGGKVGEGALFQGLRKGSVDCAQPATFEPTDPDERRWHQLPGGERIYDFAGNAFTWVFDDVQGDEQGRVAKPFSAESPSIHAPYPSLENGMGWRPNTGTNWSGDAVFRGGCWGSGSDAGAFVLLSGWPDRRGGGVGFRCTK